MSLIEKRYAEALINVAVGANALDAFQNDLAAVSDIYVNMPEFRDFLLNPENETSVRKEMVRKAFSVSLRKESLNFVLLLLDKGRVGFLPGISKEFASLADARRRVLNLTVMSALPLSKEQLDSIGRKYSSLYGAASVKINTMIDKNLVGGVKVAVGDKLTDGTVRGRLQDLKRFLTV